MTAPARKLATYEDVLHAPENMIAELIDGELLLQSRPAGAHATAASDLVAELNMLFKRGRGGPGGWLIVYEPELHLGAQPYILVPDIAGWRRDHMPAMPRAAFVSVAPDWVCEVLSPSTAGLDRGRKADVYLEVGVKYLWIVDPNVPQIEAFENTDGRWLRLGAYRDADARIVPFDAVTLDIPSLVEGVAPIV